MPAGLRQRDPHLFRQRLAVHYGAAASAAAHSIPPRFTRSPLCSRHPGPAACQDR